MQISCSGLILGSPEQEYLRSILLYHGAVKQLVILILRAIYGAIHRRPLYTRRPSILPTAPAESIWIAKLSYWRPEIGSILRGAVQSP